MEYPLYILLENDTFIVSANLIGGAAGYPSELSLSASIGFCLFPHADLNVGDIINQADSQMYAVKGRRRLRE